MPILAAVKAVRAAFQGARDLNTGDNFSKSEWKTEFENNRPLFVSAALGTCDFTEVATKISGGEKKRQGLITNAVNNVKVQSGSATRTVVVHGKCVYMLKKKEGKGEHEAEYELDPLFSTVDGKEPVHLEDISIKKMPSKTEGVVVYRVMVSSVTRLKLSKHEDAFGRVWDLSVSEVGQNAKLVQWLEGRALGASDAAKLEWGD
eukprot:comp12462_c0_seq1/m.7397 comp12462_c0_seq1/g.7397  ORF comp12462_c0_seq1/g.7397 comp12462_c0_seq1/m.7397 type:complete len:204 (-) comp12462_c0_seq1:78-689(-)